MFKTLKQKWKVNNLQLFFIICTFAIGGSLTGFIAKKFLNWLAIEHDWLWTLIYILLIIIIWPAAVIVISILFGQFRFFSKYVRRLGEKVGIVRSRDKKEESVIKRRSSLTNIAIFASGAGSNAQKINDHFRNSSSVKIELIVCNKPGAGVLEIARKENISSILIEKEKFFRGNGYADELKERNIDLIVLAGFLWKIPQALLNAWPKKIINIHPALLPKYGGRGMYGNNVHEAVLSGKEKESGITIHYVDEHYDNGDIILQVTCPVLENDTPEILAHRIHALEHANYPVIIEELVSNLGK
jgi:formyltetrahydrofolate-dependent phosphoribosylglycinamide formyltransferase